MQRERAFLLARISTESERWNNYLQQRILNNPLANDEANPVVDVTPEPEGTPSAPNHGTEIHADLPAGEGGGQQIAATNGHVYILTHPLQAGWLKIGDAVSKCKVKKLQHRRSREYISHGTLCCRATSTKCRIFCQ
jgi:hypothetical protein